MKRPLLLILVLLIAANLWAQSLSFTTTNNAQKGGFEYFNSHSVFFWFYPTWAHNDGVAHMFFVHDGGSGKLFFADKNSSNAARFGWNDGATAKFHSIAAGSYDFVQNGWNSWLYSYNHLTDTSTLWINGISEGDVTSVDGSGATWSTSGVTCWIGNYTDSAQPVVGRMAAFTVWDAAVGSTAVALALHAGTPPYRIQNADLKFYAPLDTTAGNLWHRKSIARYTNTGVTLSVTGAAVAGGPPMNTLTRPGPW